MFRWSLGPLETDMEFGTKGTDSPSGLSFRGPVETK